MKKILVTILILFAFTGAHSFSNEVVDGSKVVLDDVEIVGTKINEEDHKLHLETIQTINNCIWKKIAD